MTVLCALLLRDNGRCVAVLEVEPREVLGRTGTEYEDVDRQQDQEDNLQDQSGQPAGSTATNDSSAVVKEALFSCLEVLHTCTHVNL